jgi:capsular polysaccharide biosynthesis protein
METKQEPRTFARAFRRWWWMIAVATVVAGAIGYAVSARSERTYVAEAKLLVGPISGDANTLTAAGALAGTYTQLIQRGDVLDTTVRELGDAIIAPGSWGDMRITANGDTRIVTVAVESTDAALAARIVNQLVENFQGVVARTAYATTGRVTVLEPAVPPSSPIAPKPRTIALVAAAGAFALTTAIAIVLVAVGPNRRRRRAVDPDALANTS